MQNDQSSAQRPAEFSAAARAQQQNQTKKAVVIGTGGTAMSAVQTLLTGVGGEDSFDEVVVVGRSQKSLDKFYRQLVPVARIRNVKFNCVVDSAENPADETKATSAYGDADVVVMTAGAARTPDITREQLIGINAKIVSYYAQQVKDYASKDTKAVQLTNPLDAMTEVFLRESELPSTNVVGMGGDLDTGRAYYHLEKATGIEQHRFTDLMVLGQHGQNMVVSFEKLKLDGQVFALTAEQKQQVVDGTRNEGAKVIELTGHSATEAPGVLVAQTAEAFIQKVPIPMIASTRPNGAYDIAKSLCIALPVIVSNTGVEVCSGVKLAPDERAQLHKAAGAIEANLAQVPDLPKVGDYNMSAESDTIKDGRQATVG